MTRRADVQQALLKPEYARLYPGIPANEWRPLSVMLELVGQAAAQLDPEHFIFRGTASAGSKDEVRGRREARKARRGE